MVQAVSNGAIDFSHSKIKFSHGGWAVSDSVKIYRPIQQLKIARI